MWRRFSGLFMRSRQVDPKSIFDRVFDFADLVKGHNYMESHRATSKLVVRDWPG